MAGWPEAGRLGGRMAGWATTRMYVPDGRVGAGGLMAGWPDGRMAGWPDGRVAGWPGGRWLCDRVHGHLSAVFDHCYLSETIIFWTGVKVALFVHIICRAFQSHTTHCPHFDGTCRQRHMSASKDSFPSRYFWKSLWNLRHHSGLATGDFFLCVPRQVSCLLDKFNLVKIPCTAIESV